MTTKVNILTVSLIAMMAVTSARADIASTTYVNDKIQPVETKIDNHIANKLAVDTDQGSNLTGEQKESKTLYPSMSTVTAMLDNNSGELTSAIGMKVDKQQSSNNANKAMITNPSGQVVPGEIATAMIADKAVTNDKLSDAVNTSLGLANSAVQPAEISDMETQTHAAATYQAKALVTNFTDADDTHYPSAKAVDTAIKAATTAASSGAADALQDAKDYADGKFQVKSTKASIGGANGTWTELTDAQLAAMNSGVKAADVTQITTNKNDIAKLNGDANTNGSVAKSIADAISDLDLANTYQAKGNYATAAQGTKADNALPAATYNSQVGTVNAANMGTTATTVVGAIKELKTAITTADSTAADTYQVKSTKDYMIGNKDGGWTEMTAAEQSALKSGITGAKVTAYDNHIADGDIHVTAAQKTAWTAKQDAISDLATIRSGAAAGATAVQPGDLGTAAAKDVSENGVAANESGLVTGGQVQTAISNLNLGTTYQTKSDSTAVKGNYIAAGTGVGANLGALDTQLKTTDNTATAAAATANAAIPKPSGTCTDCVLHFNGKDYTWEEVGR